MIMNAPFEKVMVIFNKDVEVKIPLTDYQYNMVKSVVGDTSCIKDCYVFADEDVMVKELDNAIKNKMF